LPVLESGTLAMYNPSSFCSGGRFVRGGSDPSPLRQRQKGMCLRQALLGSGLGRKIGGHTSDDPRRGKGGGGSPRQRAAAADAAADSTRRRVWNLLAMHGRTSSRPDSSSRSSSSARRSTSPSSSYQLSIGMPLSGW